MPYEKNHAYFDVPFSTETPQADFFIYDVVRNLCAKCEKHKDRIIKIRTVGMFVTKNGRFYIKEIKTIHNQSVGADQVPCIPVSVVYMQSLVTPPNMPYPVQIIGLLQWKCCPVIFAQIIQPLQVPVAILLQETLNNIATKHLYRHFLDCNEPCIEEDKI